MLLVVSTVSATDNVTDVVSIDANNDVAVSTSDNIINDVVSVDEETDFVQSNYKNQSVDDGCLSTNEENKLSTIPGTFTDLVNDIANAGGELNLTKHYVYNKNDIDYLNSYDYKNGIIIDKEITINGNGFSISGENTARAFIISSNNVILNNISFTNCSRIVSTSSSYGAAICWNGGDGKLNNCSFNDCNMILSASYSYAPSIYGGAVYWNGTNGVMNDCLFNKCYVLHSSSYPSSSSSKPKICGGAVYWEGSNGHMIECTFNKCNASICPSETSLSSPVYGGAVYWNGQNGYLEKSNFKECYVLHSSSYMASASPVYGGAIYWNGAEGNLINNNFEECHASYSFQSQSQIISPNSDVYGGAIYWKGSTGYLSNSTFVNCYSNVSSKTSSFLYSRGGAIYWEGIDGILEKCIFNSCFGLEDNPYSSIEGGAVYWYGFRGILNNCSFDNCTVISSILSSSRSDIDGGAICWHGDEGSLFGCIFNNCYSSNSHSSPNYSQEVSGGAIFWRGSNSKVVDSYFSNCYVLSSSEYSFISGGAIGYYCSNAFLSNCDFINCSAKSSSTYSSSTYPTYIEGGAISLGGSNGYLSNCTFVNCSTMSLYVPHYLTGGAIDSSMKNLSITNCDFTNCSSNTGTAIHITGSNSTLMYSNFINCSSTKYDSESYVCVVWGGINGTLCYCNFLNCSSSSTKFIYWNQAGGTLGYCCFDGKNGPYQNFVYLSQDHEAGYFNPMISINVSDIFTGETQRIIINVDPGLIGNITVSQFNSSNGNILNKKYNLPINQSSFEFLIYNLTGGLYNVTVERNWDMFFKPIKLSETFEVMKYNTSISVISNNITVGDKLILNITLNENVTGNIFLNINNHQYPKAIANGKATFYISDLSVGNYSYVINYTGNQNFNPTIYKDTIVVFPAKAEITEIKVQNNTYGENIIINVKTNVTGVLTIKLNNANTQIFKIDANKLTTLDLGKYDANNYNIDLTLDAGSNYTKATGNAMVTVNPKLTTVELNVNNNVYGKNVIVNVTASENGKVTVNVGTNVRTVDVEANKHISIDFGILDAKFYEVNATFNGGNNYEESHDDTSLIVSQAQAKITEIQALNKIYGENVTVNVKTNVDGSLTVKVGNTTKVEDVIANQLTPINFGVLDVNTYDLTLNLNAGSNYISDNNLTKITVNPKVVSLTVGVVDYIYGNNVIVNVSASENGKITVKVGTIIKDFNVTANKLTSIDFDILDANDYEVTASFDAGNNYVSYPKIDNIKVTSKPTEITLNVKEYESTENVIVNVTATENGKVTIKCNNIVKTADVTANNVASFDFGVLPIGSYEVIANFTAGNNYIDSSASTTFKVLSKINDDDISISVPDIKAGQANNIAIRLPGDATGTVNLTIGKDTYTFDVINGVANVKVPELTEGNYNFTITYSGDNKYSSFSRTNSISVTKIIPTTITSSAITTAYNGGKYLVATLKDINGKPVVGVLVSINLNGVKYLTTDKNGQVKLSTNGLAPKTYTATITFAGNANYAKSTKSVKVTVKKATPKLTAGAKTFKKSVKTKKYTVTLKTNQNKVMKNTKVYLKVNKKTYTAKTNSKGVATFKITKLTKKGKYTAAVKYSGSSYYNKVTKNVKITIK